MKRVDKNNCETGSCQGFSLIELMIAVVILAILVGVAYPSYIGYVDRAKRTDATDALMSLAAQQERNYSRTASYTTDIATAFGYNVSGGWATTTENTYRFQVAASSIACPLNSCYMLEAQPIGTQARDLWQFRLSSNGQRTSREGTSGAWTANWPKR